MAITWGVLSTAKINDHMLAAADRAANAEMVAVASRDEGRARTYAAAHGLEHAFGSYDALLGSDAVEAVYISLPNALHAEWSIKALQAGKHVLCEKPFGKGDPAVALAVEEAERSGLVLAEGFMYRFHPQTVRMRELLASGEIGDVKHVNATLRFTVEGDLAADLRGSRALDGGALMDVGGYCISAARMLLGEPSWASGRAEVAGDVDVRLSGLLGFPSGATAAIDGAVNLPEFHRLEIVGASGRITVDDPWHCRDSSFTVWPGDGEGVDVRVDAEHLRGDIVDAYMVELEAVTDAIEGRGALPFGGDDILGQARAMQAMDEALRGAGVVALEPGPGRAA